jgi:glutathione synthase/RimK-type ligase-like ATP-grasp enzyme
MPHDAGRSGPLRRLALVTAAAARDLDEDLPPLEAALRELPDLQISIVNWDDAGIDWSGFDLALLRSTWDYSQRLPEFLDWVTRASAATTLLNPLAIVRWNTDKHYLHDLAAAGIATVPSVFVEPGQDAAVALQRFLQQHVPTAGPPGSDEFVVKPAVGAGSRDAQRYHRDEAAAALPHVQRLLDGRRSVLLQPYLERVDEHGETALIFFDGRFSHAIRKGPLLRRGEGPTRALFAAEEITAREPADDERRLAERTLQALPFPGPLAYARVDLIHEADGTPRVLELELTEPSLFFAHAPGSAQRFARTVASRAALLAR